MRPIPTMSIETLAFCAETRQIGAAKTSTANKTRFIIAANDVEIVVCVILEAGRARLTPREGRSVRSSGPPMSVERLVIVC